MTNFANRTLYHGDNLEFLRGMNSNTVHLIATDPPFNKSRDFHATPDSLASGARFVDRWKWERDVHQEWVDAIKDDWPGVWAVIESARIAYGDDMGAFLCWLGVRLLEMHRVLRDDGSIYLHCDATACAYIKQLMDGVFRAEHFKNEITWERTRGRSDGKHWGNTTDTILFYTKSDRYSWQNTYQERQTEAAVTTGDLTAAETRNGISGETWQGYNPTPWGRHWAVPRNNRLAEWIEEHRIPGYLQIKNPHERLDALNEAGMIAWSDNGRPSIIRPAEASAGAKVNNLWNDITRASSKERTGYPTQKPLALYERIIQASSNPGDIVLDPFCGCATTPIAAERLGRQWVGMDIWDGAIDVVRQRLADNRQLLADPNPQITYTTTPPVRTDEEDELSAPALVLKPRRIKAKWETLSHAEMRDILAEAQAHKDQVACAGCGITLPLRFMELDHQIPRKDRGANTINNRILLCGPCNRAKRENLTLSGLMARNKKAGEVTSEAVARIVAGKARDRAEQCQATML